MITTQRPKKDKIKSSQFLKVFSTLNSMPVRPFLVIRSCSLVFDYISRFPLLYVWYHVFGCLRITFPTHTSLISAITYGNENIPPNMNFGERIQHFGGHIRNQRWKYLYIWNHTVSLLSCSTNSVLSSSVIEYKRLTLFLFAWRLLSPIRPMQPCYAPET